MKQFEVLLMDLNAISIFVRLFMSIIFGGMIGFDRQKRHYPAGLRTHILVCMSSTMTMMLGQYMYEIYGADPSRIGAQVISGIGFLGAGTIILNGGIRIKGITTATGLWACACMGLMIGAGFYLGAVLSFICVLFTLLAIRSFSKFYTNKHPRTKTISAYLKELSALPKVIKLLKVWGISINETRIEYDEESKQPEYYKDSVRVLIDITFKSNTDSSMILTNLLQEDFIVYADYVKKFNKKEHNIED